MQTTLASGVLADQPGIRDVYVIGGVLLLVAGALGYARVPPAAMRAPISVEQ